MAEATGQEPNVEDMTHETASEVDQPMAASDEQRQVVVDVEMTPSKDEKP